MFGSENFILTSPLVFLFFVLAGAILAFLEYKTKAKWLLVILGALITAAAFVTFLLMGAMLSDLLLYLLVMVFIRLVFIMLERRKEG